MTLKGAAIGISGRKDILTQHGLTGDLKELVVKIFPNIPRHDAKMSYEHKQAGVDLHYIVENKFIYLVANVREDDDKMTKRIPFTYLDDIKEKFKTKFGGGGYPDANSLSESECRSFDGTLKERMSFCNDKDKVKTIQKQMAEVTDIMEKNIDSLLERGGHIDDLVIATDNLDSEAKTFRKGATNLKSTMKWRDRKFLILAVFIVLVVIGVIVLVVVVSS
eukprot:TRINITY_DN43386_c0_g1_i1.p2 TRINITY_DN43386_c0_g1~~TRINITY_DN43386_c0_g1_i1.p2  ORF type:complete len:220 (+),score=80.68 TRINITY_DN43386_c0_g1_i1:48-707(+)